MTIASTPPFPTPILTPLLRLRRLRCLEDMKPLMRWVKGSFCWAGGDCGPLGTADDGDGEVGGGGGGWRGDANKDISYR